MAEATADIGGINYVVALKTGRHVLTGDEPASRGGQDAGPAPYDLLASSLAACTAITLRMYAERKQWPLESAQVEVYADGAAVANAAIAVAFGMEPVEADLGLSADTPDALSIRLSGSKCAYQCECCERAFTY